MYLLTFQIQHDCLNPLNWLQLTPVDTGEGDVCIDSCERIGGGIASDWTGAGIGFPASDWTGSGIAFDLTWDCSAGGIGIVVCIDSCIRTGGGFAVSNWTGAGIASNWTEDCTAVAGPIVVASDCTVAGYIDVEEQGPQGQTAGGSMGSIWAGGSIGSIWAGVSTGSIGAGRLMRFVREGGSMRSLGAGG